MYSLVLVNITRARSIFPDALMACQIIFNRLLNTLKSGVSMISKQKTVENNGSFFPVS